MLDPLGFVSERRRTGVIASREVLWQIVRRYDQITILGEIREQLYSR